MCWCGTTKTIIWATAAATSDIFITNYLNLLFSRTCIGIHTYINKKYSQWTPPSDYFMRKCSADELHCVWYLTNLLPALNVYWVLWYAPNVKSSGGKLRWMNTFHCSLWCVRVRVYQHRCNTDTNTSIEWEREQHNWSSGTPFVSYRSHLVNSF